MIHLTYKTRSGRKEERDFCSTHSAELFLVRVWWSVKDWELTCEGEVLREGHL